MIENLYNCYSICNNSLAKSMVCQMMLCFLHEYFLQRLPPNVRMVLASADATMDLWNLADMADKVMEVATPTVSAISDTYH